MFGKLQILNKYDWSDAIIVTNCLQEVYTRQVLQPQEEEKLKSEIKVLGEISNRISSKVRNNMRKALTQVGKFRITAQALLD